MSNFISIARLRNSLLVLIYSTWCPAVTVSAPPRPNVLILVADDLGFSDLGCYGGEIRTPTLDALAATGTRFSNFHTAATCSPTRAMLLTGVDHHRAGLGSMVEFLRSTPEQLNQTGYEGYLNRSVVTIAEVLRSSGYVTAIAGKWHLGGQLVASQAPIGRGFDHSWVLWSGWAEHFGPNLSDQAYIDGDRRVQYPVGRYSTEWYTEKAMEFADRAIDANQPFFLVAAYTAPHWPLQAPAAAIAQQKGRYQAGYESLRQNRIAGLVQSGILPPHVPLATTPPVQPPLHHDAELRNTERWDVLNDGDRLYSARLMEVHAAMVEVLDQQIGRLFQHLQSRDQFDNTLIIFLSDNGASSLFTSPTEPGNELSRVGHSGSFVGYGAEWARASTGPLRLMKGYPSEGGIRVPAIVRLPHGQQSQITHSFASVLDIAPTIYELTGTAYPQTFNDQSLHPLAGESMLPVLQGQSDSVHQADYAMGWELFGRAAFQRGKWKITWIEQPFGASDYQLFDMSIDPGEAHDVRHEHPAEFQQLVAGYDEYARSHGVIVVRPETWQRKPVADPAQN